MAMNNSFKRSALTVALGLCFAGGVQAQSTSGTIYGNVGQGATVTVQNESGFTRTVTADASGRYNISSLPVGNYTVRIEQNGAEVASRTAVVRPGAGADVSTVAAAGSSSSTFDTVNISADSIPPIDITATDTRSILTSEQINRLPLARSAEAIALLAPGAVSGASGFFGGLVSFGGAGVSENAYYVNGFFTGDPLSNLGGFTLPFGSIAQQETYTGGYSAKYGRSDGGVISQIGKRGTNNWHFGGQVTYTPKSLRGETKDRYYPNVPMPAGYEYTDDSLPGTKYQNGKDHVSWNESYNLYAGGPIIKDRLFIFAGGELNRSHSRSNPTSTGTQRTTHTDSDNPRLYAKLDWNITDNHIVELTYLGEKTDQTGEYYAYNFADNTEGAKNTVTYPDPFWQKNQYTIGKYTGYLTDNLTLSAMYGESKQERKVINQSVIPGLPILSGTANQNPALNGGTPIRNAQGGWQGTDALDRTKGYRVDLEWVLGDHTLTAGVDNMKFVGVNEGVSQLVPRWDYARAASGAVVVPGVVGAPTNPDGYYVFALKFQTAAGMSLEQRAWYLEDRWQITPNFLLSLGVRNDQFTNKNNFGETYMDAKNQWAPRIGFAWDAFGDSTLKVFGNAGRYFLAMPNNVAIRGASASTFTREYFDYTGIDANGAPTGLTPIARLDGGTGPFSSNGEYGQAVDVLSFAPKDLKNMYQDEYILGFEKMLTSSWMVGVKMTHRDLKSAIDDICDPGRMDAALTAKGIDTSTLEIPGCLMFNPGGTNTFSLKHVGSNNRTEVQMNSADWGFDAPMKRKYNGVDIYFERAFDGKWEARFDYTFSKSTGNMEGQVKSEFGQSNISKTQDWDAAEIMRYSSGYLANDRRHQFKARGSLQLTDELLVGANLRIQSGAPISCLGYFNPGNIDENSAAADPIHYGASYHTCFGAIATPGSKRTPWTRNLDLGLTYRPNWADKKLSLGVQVRNVLNTQETLQVDVTSEDSPYTVSNTYMLPIGRQTPRTVVFTAGYDW